MYDFMVNIFHIFNMIHGWRTVWAAVEAIIHLLTLMFT